MIVSVFELSCWSICSDIMSFLAYFYPGNLGSSFFFFVLFDLSLNKSKITKLWWNIQQVLLGSCTVGSGCLFTLHRVRGFGLKTLARLWMMSLNNWPFLISCALPCGQSEDPPGLCILGVTLWAELEGQSALLLNWLSDFCNRPFSLGSSRGAEFQRGQSVKPCSKLRAEK